MLLDILMTDNSQLGPDARYCLSRFALRFGDREAEGLSTKELAKGFGVSEQVMSASLKALVDAGALICRSVLTGKKGRAGRFYRVSKEWVKGDSDSCHLEAITELLQQPRVSMDSLPMDYPPKADYEDKLGKARVRGITVRKTRQLGRLSNVNRLIMAVLLCRADRLGVVRTLGHADLLKLTGLTSGRLSNRIKTLLTGGLIRTYVPGATSTALFRPTKSFYFLNLGHPDLADPQQVVTSIVFRYPWEGEEIEGEAGVIFRTKVSSDDRFTTFFNDKHELAVSRVFQVRIDEYVSCFLSMSWPSLGSIPHTCNTVLMDRIREDFKPPRSKTDGEADIFPDEGELQRLLKMLYRAALRKAKRIQMVMQSVVGVDFHSMDHLVLPSPVVSFGGDPIFPFASVLSAPRSVSNGSGCYVVDLRISSHVCFSTEQEISLEDRYCYGLLTPPEGQLTVVAGKEDIHVVRR